MSRKLVRECAQVLYKELDRLALAALALCFATGVSAQSAGPIPPDMKVLSPGKVDMVDGHLANDTTDLTVGPSGDGLDLVRVAQRSDTKPWKSNWHFEMEQRGASGGYYYTIKNSAVGKTWYNASGSTSFQNTSLSFDGSTKLELLGTGASQYFKYTGADGTIIQFQPGTDGVSAQSLTRPDGLNVQFQYDTGGTSGATRLRRVSDNRGYVLVFEYAVAGNIDAISKVCAINAALTAPPVANTCPAGSRSVSYGYSGSQVTSVTDAAGKIASVAVALNASGHLASQAFTKPGTSLPYLTVNYGSPGIGGLSNVVLSQAYASGPTYTYTYQDYGTDFPDLTGRGVAWSEASGLDTGSLAWGFIAGRGGTTVTPTPTSVTSAGMTVNYTLNPQWTAITDRQLPSGLTAHYPTNANGSIVEVRSIPPGGSSDPQIATTYTYADNAGCTNDVLCHKPLTKTDPRGNTTDFTYDAVHGGVLTETEPAPASGGIRPQTRYTYQQLYARYYNSSGAIVQAPTPIWKLVQSSECQTTASCINGADEVRTVIAYPSGTGAFNLIPASKMMKTGTGTILAAASSTYDANGDKLTEDGPLAGTADTTRWRYDAMRRVIGVVGPDPDGVGALKFRAVRNSYDDAGRVTMVEQGTVNSQSDADWAAFAPLERDTNTYDLQDRLIKTVHSGKSGASFVDAGVTQMSYDAIGRVLCKAARMDPAQWNSQTDPCVPQTSAANGPDRITHYTYNSQNLITKTDVAYGTSIAAAEVTNSWTVNGKLASVTDGERNTTTYSYDGHDRLTTTQYPVASKGAGTSSATDYEQLTYDLASNVTARRLRDGTSIGFTFDNLNRATLKNLPSSDPDVSYAYDNLDRTTSVSQTGHALSYGYDPLGRLTSESGPLGTVTSTWDAAGRRKTLAYPGTGLTLNYDYFVTGELQKIRENNATTGVGVLASYAFDDLGRRTSLTRGNGTATSYGYDHVSRPISLSQDLAGTANDLTISGFTYNPASQITGYTRSNDAYAWTGSVGVSRGYNANGLNQYSSAGAVTFGYDPRGNLTTDGSVTYSYDSENKLVSAAGSNSGTLTYDPKQRLYQVTGTATTRFAYDGVDAIAEYDGTGALLRRYVHGPSDDDPVVWYEGTGLTDRRWLHGDERGSVVATSDASGNMLAIDTYDEYGLPKMDASGVNINAGRFQYTGQMWIDEVGLYYYKARFYSPKLGRFLQTDPTGYDDGPNWYAYAGDDPIGGGDPSGTDCGSRIEGVNTCGGTSGVGFNTQPDDPKRALGGNIQVSLAGFTPAISGLDTTVLEDVLDNALTFAALGKAGEDAAVIYLLNKGYTIDAQHLYVKTKDGTRIVDIVATEPSGRQVAYEVKAGFATRSSSQRRKDKALFYQGGEVRSRSKGGFEYGSRIVLPTGELQVRCASSVGICL